MMETGKPDDTDLQEDRGNDKAVLVRVTEEPKDEPTPPRGLSSPVVALVAAAFGVLMTVLAFYGTRTYGIGLFVITPVLQGVMAGVLHGLRADRTRTGAVGAALLSCLFTGLAVLVFGLDGLICVIMAIPIALPLAVLGALCATLFYPKCGGMDVGRGTCMALTVWLVTPGAMGVEKWLDRKAPVQAVTSRILVHAPPETVWDHVIEFPDLAPPTEAVFKTGIAYPVRASIKGRGVGAVRYCEFSTGPFVEPVTRWEPPHWLAFDVAEQPLPMKELTLFSRDIHPPHLDDMLFVSQRGEFRLAGGANGSTLLTGTTWYTNGMWPVDYWKLWSDWIIHRIHMQVLEHIKVCAEQDV